MQNFEQHLHCWTLNAKSGVSVEYREKMDLPQEGRAKHLQQFLQSAALSEQSALLYVSTCHRVELYAYHVDVSKITSLWQSISNPLLNKAQYLQGRQVLSHLMRVASSLESEVLGETQITGQIKDAASFCKELGVLKGPLERCVQWTHRCAKRVRSESELGSGTVSVAHVAVDGLSDVFDSLQDKSALVVGAGPMALQALERLQKRSVGEITWINRSKEKLIEHPLSQQCAIADFAQLPKLAWKHQIVVLATASPNPILNKKILKAHQKHESGESPRVVLDLGHPRNADEDMHGFGSFYVRNVDEFRDKADKNTEVRRKSVHLALQLVEEEITRLLEESQNWARGPLISLLSRSLEELIEEERMHLKLEKTPEIVYFSRNVHGKILHRIIQELEVCDEAQSLELLKTMVNAWRQTAEWPQKNQQPENPLKKNLLSLRKQKNKQKA